MKPIKLPNIKTLRGLFCVVDKRSESYLIYNPERPRSSFKTEGAYKRYCSTLAGKRAGAIETYGGGRREVIVIGKHKYVSARVMWALRNGKDPWPFLVDHIDGNNINNKPKNHRLVTDTENNRNKAKSKRNTSGVTGVYWRADTNKWSAIIGVNGKTKKLGSFTTMAAAKKARRDAERELGYHANHGKRIAA